MQIFDSEMSSVWDYATKRKNAKTKKVEGQCLQCNKIIKCSGRSTSLLKSHLHTHGIDINHGTSEKVARKQMRNKAAKLLNNFLKGKV